MPADATQAYEALRAEVLQGQARPDGLGAIVFHGMWCGLRVLLQAPSAPAPSPVSASNLPVPPTQGPQLVHLIANLVLLTQSREEYAY